MDQVPIFSKPLTLHAPDNAPQGLAAWPGATSQPEQSQESLWAEVQRLTAELEVKNRELERKSRRADLGRMASHIAHEMRNDLVPVTLYLSLLRRRLSDDPGSVDILTKVESGLLTLDATVNDMLHFTSDRDPKPQWVNVRQVVDDVFASLSPQLAAQDIETQTDVPRNLGILADTKMLRCAILNLSLNALDAMPDGGRLVVTSYIGRNGLELEVADSGPGLSEETQRHIFEPFYSTKSGGTGLGLAIVHRIAEVHGGNIVAANCPEGGAAFTLRIPQRAQQAAA